MKRVSYVIQMAAFVFLMLLPWPILFVAHFALPQVEQAVIWWVAWGAVAAVWHNVTEGAE